MHISKNALHFVKAFGFGIVVLMIWLTANRSPKPAQYANSQLKVTGNFIGGKAEGAWTWWYMSGKKMSEGVFVDGVRKGPWTTWYSDGTKKSEAIYEQDMLNGKYTMWHANGKLKFIGNYQSDQLDGIQQYYDTLGRLKEERIFEKGEEVHTSLNN